MTFLRATAVLALVLSGAAPALAQDCVPGMLPSEGHCCWRGQSFSASAGTCLGTPECPAGMRVDATGTVCELVLGEPQAIVATGTLDIDALWPAGGESGPPGGRNPRYETEPDASMRDIGIAFLVGGWLTGVLTGSINAAASSSFDGPFAERWGWELRRRFPTDCADLAAGLSFIPILGPALAGGYNAACPYGDYRNNVLVAEGSTGEGTPLFGFVPATLSQIVGLILVLAGLGSTHEVPRLDAPTASLEIDLEGTADGLALTLRF